MTSKILLIYPPYSLKEEFSKLAEVGNMSQSLGLAYLAAVLEDAGKIVKIIDAPPLGYSVNDILKEADEFRPDIIGLTSVTSDFYKAEKITQRIKEKLNCTVIIGGPHITATPLEVIKNSSFDFGVIGEGEETTLELINALEEGRGDFENIKGIIFKKGSKIIKTAPRPFIKDLDSLPFPARHLMPPLDLYHPTPASYKKLPVGSMITSRGCPFRCIFCDRSIFGNALRFRSPKNIVDEMEVLIKDYGAREIRLWDDTFNAQPERVIKICKEILKRKIKVPWTCLGRVNFANEKMFKMMKKAGCWQISYGIESGNSEVLKTIKKDLTKEMVQNALSLTKKAGIGTRGFFMFGLPGDTKESMQDTIDFAKSMPLDTVGFYVTIPFPGNELHSRISEFGKLRKVSYKDYLMNLPDDLPFVPHGLDSKTIREYENKAYRQFYFRPSYLLRQFFQIRSFQELFAKIKAFFVIKKI